MTPEEELLHAIFGEAPAEAWNVCPDCGHVSSDDFGLELHTCPVTLNPSTGEENKNGEADG